MPSTRDKCIQFITPRRGDYTARLGTCEVSDVSCPIGETLPRLPHLPSYGSNHDHSQSLTFVLDGSEADI